MDLAKCMQVGGDMKHLWIIFDHVKCMKDWTTLMYHVYNSKCYKVLTIACCDMQSKNDKAQNLL